MRAAVPLLVCALAIHISAAVNPYAGAIGGIATLSADAATQATADGLSISAYSPSNGGAVNVFAGVHVHNYVSVQANYIWNRNDVVLSSTSPAADTFYEQEQTVSQHAFVLDVLIYFRPKRSRIRPYLGTGGGVSLLSSEAGRILRSGGNAIIPAGFSSTRPVFRSHVGIDLRLHDQLDFRYSFSEMIKTNDISRHLSPPGGRAFANFQNLFGFVVRF